MWGKKIVVEINDKYSDQKKQQMVSYIVGKVYDKILHFRFSIKHSKKNVCRTFIPPKKVKTYLRSTRQERSQIRLDIMHVQVRDYYRNYIINKVLCNDATKEKIMGNWLENRTAFFDILFYTY